METKFFADIIKEVLVRDGIACLPGLGSLVTEQVPAFFSDKGFTINPPYLKIVFNADILDDDSLVEFYARNNGITKPRAAELISEQVGVLCRDLMASHLVALPGLGYLKTIHDGKPFFVAEEGLNIFPSFDLLEPVSLRHLPSVGAPVRSVDVPVQPEVQEVPAAAPVQPMSQEAPAQQAETPAEPAGKPHGKTFLWFLLAIVLIAAVFFATLAVLGRTCPDIVDPWLYNASELEIVKQIL